MLFLAKVTVAIQKKSQSLQNWLSLDKRSLGLFRIGLGFCLLLDAITRGLFFRAHYSSQGVFPLQDFLVQPGADLRRWSLLFMNDNPLFVGLFFAFSLVCAGALMLGYRVRVTGWLCWILWVSMFRRNPLVTNSGDLYLPLLLFWGNFLPWAERFSVQPALESPAEYEHLPAFCYQVQVCILYWFSALFRSSPEWQVDYSALYFALRAERFNAALAPWLLTLGSDILAVITYVTLALELIGPIFLLLPFWRVRAVCVLLIMSFHTGIIFSLNIPIFALLGIVGPIGLFPSKIWDLRPLRFLEERVTTGFAKLTRKLRVSPVESAEVPHRLGKVRALYPWLTLPAMVLVLFGLHRGVYYPNGSNYLFGVVRAFSLDQRWGMFSPRPPKQSGWQRIPATTSSGRTVDLFNQEDLDLSLPAVSHHQELYNTRWAKLHAMLADERPGHNRLYLQYLVERWNQANPEDQVLTARWEYHRRTSPPDYMLGDLEIRVFASYPH